MRSQNRRFPIPRIVTVGFLVVIDCLFATFVIRGMTSPAQTVLYLLANILFVAWLVIVWRSKTATAIGFLVTMLMILGVAVALDYFTATIIAPSRLDSLIAIVIRTSLGLLSAASGLFILRKMSFQHRRIQSFLWFLFPVGMGLFVSTLSLPTGSGVDLLVPSGLTILILGTVFPRRKRIAELSILAIWIYIFAEMLSVSISTGFPVLSANLEELIAVLPPHISALLHLSTIGVSISTGFPVLSASSKDLIAILPPYIYALLYLPALYFALPRIWKAFLNNRNRIVNGWKLFSESTMGKIGLSVVLAMVLIGIFAPYLAPYPYHELNIKEMTLPPSWKHPLGTNHYGEDLLSRVIWGSRISLLVGFSAAALSMVIGTLIGVVSGYYGGAPDSILMRITDLFLSVPTLPLMLIFAALFGKGLMNIILVLSILGWTGTARMVRSETLSLKEQPLTEAARAIGATDMHVLGRHILPNVLPLILANMVLSVVSAILGEAWVSFLGYGVSVEEPPSWGIILYWADLKLAVLNNYWWWIVPPGLLLMFLVLGFAFMSHALDQVLNPRLRRRRR